jgi:hypothetical protein
MILNLKTSLEETFSHRLTFKTRNPNLEESRTSQSRP